MAIPSSTSSAPAPRSLRYGSRSSQPDDRFGIGPAGIPLSCLIVRVMLVNECGYVLAVGDQYAPRDFGRRTDFSHDTGLTVEDFLDLPMYQVPAGTPVVRLDRSDTDAVTAFERAVAHAGGYLDGGSTAIVRAAERAGITVERTPKIPRSEDGERS